MTTKLRCSIYWKTKERIDNGPPNEFSFAYYYFFSGVLTIFKEGSLLANEN